MLDTGNATGVPKPGEDTGVAKPGENTMYKLYENIPPLDEAVAAFVKETPDNMSLQEVIDLGVEKFKDAAQKEVGTTIHDGGLITPAMMDCLLEDVEVANMGKVIGGILLDFLEMKRKDGNLTMADIDSIFHGMRGTEVNFSFPALGLLADGLDNGYPKPYKSAMGIDFETIWVAGDDKLPAVSLDADKVSNGWYVPVCTRVPDAEVEKITQEVDAGKVELPGVLFKLQATITGVAKPGEDTGGTKDTITEAYYFQPRDGWNGVFLGPLNFMDCSDTTQIFRLLNAAYCEFRDKHPKLCDHFDYRVAKTVFESETHCIKIHKNMEMMTLAPAANTNDVTLAPAQGFQIHATMGRKDGTEIAKFCRSKKGLIYAIPFTPFAKGVDKKPCWSPQFVEDPKVPMMFYAFAHLGEQTSRSWSHKRTYPEAFHTYKTMDGTAAYVRISKLGE
jgi:hypothetical protein